MMGGSEASEYTDSRQSNDSGLWRRSVLGGPTRRGILSPSVDAVSVVVVDVFTEKTLQMFLVQDDHVVEKLPTSAADPSLWPTFCLIDRLYKVAAPSRLALSSTHSPTQNACRRGVDPVHACPGRDQRVDRVQRVLAQHDFTACQTIIELLMSSGTDNH